MGGGAPSDVVVVGSGAAGLAGALAAAKEGARVTLIEKAERLGGTTALSGGVAWLPGNDLIGASDTDAALAYFRSLDLGDTSAELIRAFVGDGARVARFIESETPIVWQAIQFPDYHAEFRGGAQGGRSLEPRALEVSAAVRGLVRDAPTILAPITYAEMDAGSYSRELLTHRVEAGILTQGPALVAGLLQGVLDAGVEVRVGERVRGLMVKRDVVQGVAAGEEIRGRVLLATGGFERDPALVKAFLRGPMVAPTGVPQTTGDGLRMAMSVGAELGNMSEAWWCPAIRVPGDDIDGAPLHRLLLSERAYPGSLMVDRLGCRFVNEAENYNDVGRMLHSFDATAFDFPRIPSWLIFDAAYRQRYHFATLRRSDPDPAWLIREPTLPDIAKRIGVQPETLVATVERFNDQAARGRDDDFGRGDHLLDAFLGDRRAEHPTLAPLSEAPFYAMEVLPGCLGTKGGPRTDSHGRVLAADGSGVIPGLYAAGNAAASPFGYAYPGAGGTIGPALVFGTRSGTSAASD